MGNYWSSTINKTAVETILKDMLYEIDVYVSKDGYKPYTARTEEGKKLRDLEFGLREVAINLRNADEKKIDLRAIEDLIEEGQPIVNEIQTIGEYPLKQNFDELVRLFQVVLNN